MDAVASIDTTERRLHGGRYPRCVLAAKRRRCPVRPRAPAVRWRRDIDRRRSIDRAAHGALRTMGLDWGVVDGAAVRLRQARGLLAAVPSERGGQA